ncbi:MAG: hypothetical protein AB8H79_17150 [Myxococcota bacterium]
MSKKTIYPRVERALQYEAKFPLADTPMGVRKVADGYEVFSRERGCETGSRSYGSAKQVDALLAEFGVRP